MGRIVTSSYVVRQKSKVGCHRWCRCIGYIYLSVHDAVGEAILTPTPGAAAAAAFGAEEYFDVIKIFERRQEPGGTWYVLGLDQLLLPPKC